MKRSEFEIRGFGHHARYLADLAEEAGVQWEPEEPELPGRLGIGPHYSRGWSIWDRGHAEDLNAAMRGGAKAIGYASLDRELLEKILARYNLVDRIFRGEGIALDYGLVRLLLEHLELERERLS